MSSVRRRTLLALAAALSVMVLVLAWQASRQRPAPRCPAATSFGMTFVQPLARDAGRGVAGWRRLFTQLRRMGVGEVVVQWTSLDGFDTYPRDGTAPAKSSLIGDLVKAAEAERVAVWIGLRAETAFWTVADQPPEAIAAYFARRVADLEERLPALLTALNAAGSPVAGWYVSEEIDDTRWRDPERRALLDDYLTRTRRALAAARPGWPVMVSAFANGAQGPADYGAYLHGLADKAGFDALLFQDGVGAGKLSVGQAAGYLKALKDQAGRARVVPIVELFDFAADGAIRPAPLPRILDQIDAEAPFASPTLAAFAIPDHMLATADPRAKALLRDWRAMVAHCAQAHRTGADGQKDR